MAFSLSRSFSAALVLLVSGTCQVYAQSSMSLSVDLRDAPRKMLHATEVIAVQPGPMTLAYPQWVPNERALGPLTQQVGVFIETREGGASHAERIPWTRDPVELYLYHFNVPAGVHSIEVRSDFITSESGGGPGGSTDASIAVLDWNTVVLYPYGGPKTKVADLIVRPSVVLPDEWHAASVLRSRGEAPFAASSPITFAPVSLAQLVDSPLIAGRYLREIPLAPEITPSHYLDLVADDPAELQIAQARVDELSQGIRQAGYLFRSHHYNDFHFLITLSNNIAQAPIDHHQSLDDRRPAGFFRNEKNQKAFMNYTIHDFLHSWSGNYRRPEGLAAANFQVPVTTGEMWIVEGLTSYLADLITVRAGIMSPKEYLVTLAALAASSDRRPGRQWRDLDDTALMELPLSANGNATYDSWRRDAFDVYSEGEMIWLDVDVTIRNKTQGKKSLNDFVALFHGPETNTGPTVVPYTLQDVVSGLNQIVPNDWARFLNQRLHTHRDAPLGGIDSGGYRLVYLNEPDAGFRYSLGMSIRADGTISDVLVGGVADMAGFGPGMKILSVDGQPFTTAVLQQVIDAARATTTSTQFQVDNTGVESVLHLAYHGGQRHPVLQRIPDTPDRLSEILQPMTQ